MEFLLRVQLLSVVLCSSLYHCNFNHKLITSAPEQELLSLEAYHHHFNIEVERRELWKFPVKSRKKEMMTMPLSFGVND